LINSKEDRMVRGIDFAIFPVLDLSLRELVGLQSSGGRMLVSVYRGCARKHNTRGGQDRSAAEQKRR
jgi:hypothetical protein